MQGKDTNSGPAGPRGRWFDPMRLLIAAAVLATVVVFLRNLLGVVGGREDDRPPEPPPGTNAMVTECKGLVRITPAEADRSGAVNVGRLLDVGDVLQVTPNARATIRFGDGDEVRLFGNARLTILGGSPGNRVRLEQGTVFVRALAADGGSDLVMVTDIATVTAATARYLARADAERTTLGVGEGEITVARAPDGAAVAVKAGHNAVVGGGGNFRTAKGCFCAALGQAMNHEMAELNEPGKARRAGQVRVPRYRGRLPSIQRRVGEAPSTRRNYTVRAGQ